MAPSPAPVPARRRPPPPCRPAAPFVKNLSPPLPAFAVDFSAARIRAYLNFAPPAPINKYKVKHIYNSIPRSCNLTFTMRALELPRAHMHGDRNGKRNNA